MAEIETYVSPEVKYRQEQDAEYRKYKVKKQLKKEGQECWATNCCVRFPGTCCSLCYILLFIITGAAFAMEYFDLNDQSYRDFLIWDDQRTVDWDM